MKRASPAEREAALDRYRALIERFHGTLDLMSDDGLRRLSDHLADAEAYADALEWLSPAPGRLLDVGSGVGLPGVVIAASFPSMPVELVERRRKRAAFLRMALAAVDAPRARVFAGDVRACRGEPVDVVSAQAVASVADVYRMTRHRHADRVVLITRKGPSWRDELAELAAETGSAAEVLAAEPLRERGTLVAVRVQGGVGCRSSG